MGLTVILLFEEIHDFKFDACVAGFVLGIHDQVVHLMKFHLITKDTHSFGQTLARLCRD